MLMGLITVGILKYLSSVVKSFTSSASLVMTSILSSFLLDVELKYPIESVARSLTPLPRFISPSSISRSRSTSTRRMRRRRRRRRLSRLRWRQCLMRLGIPRRRWFL